MARNRKTEVVETATEEKEIDGIEFIEKAFAEAPVINTQERKPAFRKANPLATAGLWISILAIVTAATGLVFAYAETGVSETPAALVFVVTGYVAITVFAPTALALSIAGFITAARSGYWFGGGAKVGKGKALAGVIFAGALLLTAAIYAVTSLTESVISVL